MTDPLALPLTVYRRVAAASVLIPVILFVASPVPALLLLLLAFFWHYVSIAWVDARRDRWPADRVVTAFCLAEWSAAVAITAIEGWALHLTPIMCLGPVVLAIQVVDRVRYRQLVVGAVVVIAGMSVLGRLTDPGPIYRASNQATIDVVAIVMTPALAGIVALLAWLNHRSMAERQDLLARSRERLDQAEESARVSFTEFSLRMQARIGALRRRLVAADGRRELAAVNAEIQEVSAEIRSAAHGIGVHQFDLDDAGAVEALVAAAPQPVSVDVGSVGERDPVVDSVARAVVADAISGAPGAQRSSVAIGAESRQLRIEVDHVVRPGTERAVSLGLLTTDRIGAIGGAIEHPLPTAGHAGLLVELPLARAPGPAPPPHDLQTDLYPGLVLPVLSVVTVLVVWATVLRESELLVVAGQLVVLFAVPCALAIAFAPTRPWLAIAMFVGAYWVSAIVVIDQLHILKYFVAIALLVPLLMALPHVDRRAFTFLTFGTCVVIAFAVAIARLTPELGVASDAPESITDAVVIVMIPLCSALVLAVSGDNYNAMAAVSEALAEARHERVAAADRAQRAIERDLHDGTQQRLVSAALRTQVAARLDDPLRVDDNVQAAITELGRAEESLAGLATGRSGSELAGTGLPDALRQLAHDSPRPVRVRVDGRPEDLPEPLRTTIWFCCTEALANAIKHAGEDAEISIDLWFEPVEVGFEVSDNGAGLGAEDASGQGLRNMSERVEQVGGTLRLRSRSGSGTTVVGCLPRRHPAVVGRDDAG